MSNKIWAVMQHRDGKLHKMSWEAIRAAQVLAESIGGQVEAVLLGHETESIAQELAGAALDGVLIADHAQLANYTPGAYIGVLQQAASSGSPAWILFPHTYQTVDYAPRLAHALDAALVPEITGFETSGDSITWQRPVLNGKLQAKVAVKAGRRGIVTIQSAAFAADEVQAGSAPISAMTFDSAAIAMDRQLVGVEAAASDQVDLSQSEFIVSVGRGIGDPEKIGIVEDLAKALGAELGASRPVIDSGWLPRERQIGSSGQTVAPKIYVAVGISGAIQHLVGMKGSQVVVAINKDAGAPIFSVADYGIVGDLHEVVPLLADAIRAAKAG